MIGKGQQFKERHMLILLFGIENLYDEKAFAEVAVYPDALKGIEYYKGNKIKIDS